MKTVLGVLIVFLCVVSHVSAQSLSLGGGSIVQEGQSLQACVTYTSPPAGDVTVVLATRERLDGAIAGQDFQSVLENLEFDPSSPLQMCIGIIVNDDNSLEGFEQFDVLATIDGTDIQNSPAIGIISNTDLTVEVGFSASEYSFNEDESGMICVLPQNGGSVETVSGVTLRVTPSDGTAEGGTDYDSVGLSAFEISINRETPLEGECFTVPITPDTRAEADETFTITIQPAASTTISALLGTTTITIVNDDDDCATTDPPMLDNASLDINGGRTSAVYTCDEGYSGGSTLDCTAGYSWSPLMPAPCDAVECPPLSDPGNGTVAAPQLTFESTATYSCDSGYTIIGDSTRTCQADMTWSGEEPSCGIVTCPALSPPSNGMVSQPSDMVGDVATYSCDDGFNLIATAGDTRTCQADGAWSGEAPSCTVITVGGTGGQLTPEQVTGVAVGVSIGAAVIIAIVVIIVIVACFCCIRSRKNEKYTLNYSTTYGDQRTASDPIHGNAYEGQAGNGENVELTEKA